MAHRIGIGGLGLEDIALKHAKSVLVLGLGQASLRIGRMGQASLRIGRMGQGSGYLD